MESHLGGKALIPRHFAVRNSNHLTFLMMGLAMILEKLRGGMIVFDVFYPSYCGSFLQLHECLCPWMAFIFSFNANGYGK